MGTQHLAWFATIGLHKRNLCFGSGVCAVPGTLPPELGQLRWLEHLILLNNHITGMTALGNEMLAALV